MKLRSHCGKLTIALILICFNFGCHEMQQSSNVKEGEKATAAIITDINDEDFEGFRARFFEDSLFQLSRITFPLRGMSTDYVFDEESSADTVGDTFFIENKRFFWTKANWSFMRDSIINTSEFSLEEKYEFGSRELRYASDKEDIVLFFKFEFFQKKWFLTYYSFEWN